MLSGPSLSILVNYEQESSFNVDLHATPCCELLHHISQSSHSFWGLSKNRDVVDETYVIKLIAVVGILTAVILVLASPVIRLGLRNPRKKERTKAFGSAGYNQT